VESAPEAFCFLSNAVCCHVLGFLRAEEGVTGPGTGVDEWAGTGVFVRLTGRLEAGEGVPEGVVVVAEVVSIVWSSAASSNRFPSFGVRARRRAAGNVCGMEGVVGAECGSVGWVLRGWWTGTGLDAAGRTGQEDADTEMVEIEADLFAEDVVRRLTDRCGCCCGEEGTGGEVAEEEQCKLECTGGC
jgi:hypothetical protein